MRKIKRTNSEIMKELMKHIPAIKNFIEERTQTLQEISDSMIKKFLTEAYKLPFLFPVRIIVSEDKFVNFLFDMRKELFEGKNIETSSKNIKEQSQVEEIKTQEEEKVKIEQDIPNTNKATNKAVVATKKAVKNTSSVKEKTSQKKETTQKAKKTSTKKEKILA